MPTIKELEDKLRESEVKQRLLHQRIGELTALAGQSKSCLADPEEQKAMLNMAASLTGIGTWAYDMATATLNWSAECRNIFGTGPDTPVTFSLFAEHIHPEDRGLVQEVIRQTLDPKGNNSYELSFRILRFDTADVRWITSQGKAHFNEEAKPVRFIGTVLDITENRARDLKLASSEQLFRSIAANIPNSLIIVIDKDYHFVAVEGDIMTRLGYKSSDFEGKHVLGSSPEPYETSGEFYRRMLSGEHFSVERKAANDADFMVHFVPLPDQDNQVYAGLIIATDITKIKQAEVKSARLAAIVESSNDAIVSKNLDSVITSWNISAERIFGYTESEMIGQSILTIIPEDRQDEESLILSKLKSGQRVEHFETQRMTKSGNLLDVSLTISPVKDANGKLIGLSKIARDITERKQEETRKQDFIAMVSHELKTPLTSIQAYIQLLIGKSSVSADAFTKNALERTAIQAKKMTAMIQDFLSLARLEEGKIQFGKSVFELNEMIGEVVKEVGLITATHRLDFKSCMPVLVNADRDKIGQVVVNLISNAAKYSQKGKNIKIGCDIIGQQVRVYVTDEGIGINPKDQSRLFERFYRVNNENIKNIAGFGIGLYLVAEILRNHNSTILVESTEGVGSTFYFYLDIA